MDETAAPGTDQDDRHLHTFRPIRLRKAADVVIAVLADAIRGGLYKPGDLLPNERSLAAQLNVSRTVVREAVDVLRRAGIVSVKRGAAGGITVISDTRLREVVASLRGEMHDLMRWALETRRCLEPPAFALAAARATDAELEQLKPLVERLEDLIDLAEAFYVQDLEFHRQVVRLSGNPLLTDCYRTTIDRLMEIRQDFPVLQVGSETALENQRTLYTALRSRDPEPIAAAVEEHLQATEIIYLGEPLPQLAAPVPIA